MRFDLIKASQAVNPREGFSNPNLRYRVYDAKGVFDIPEIRQALGWEVRYGAVVAIHQGDDKPILTVLPLFSYSGEGLRYKFKTFCIQHLASMDRRKAKREAANPHVPLNHSLFVDSQDHFCPGARDSFVVLSKPQNVYVDSRIHEMAGCLKVASSELLGDIWSLYMRVSTLNIGNRATFDYGKFEWLKPMMGQTSSIGEVSPRSNRSPGPASTRLDVRKTSNKRSHSDTVELNTVQEREEEVLTMRGIHKKIMDQAAIAARDIEEAEKKSRRAIRFSGNPKSG